MEIQHYCYTRGHNPDYRDFIIPQNINVEDKSIIKNLVMPILNSFSDKPVWILYKTPSVIVWGLCCKNSTLSQQYNIDEKGRPVNGFFSIVISDYTQTELRVPYDIKYFKNLYEAEISPHWLCEQGASFDSRKSCMFNDSFLFIKANDNTNSHVLNTDIFKCKQLGDSDTEKVISSALTTDNITLAIGYDGLSDASFARIPFMNCIMKGEEEHTISVKRICPKCGKKVSHFTPEKICDSCANERKNTMSPDIEINKEKEKKEIIELKRKLRDCQLELEEKDKIIYRQKLATKLSWIICGLLLLLCLWMFKKSNFSFGLNTKNYSVMKQFDQVEIQKREYFINVNKLKNHLTSDNGKWKTNYSEIEVK